MTDRYKRLAPLVAGIVIVGLTIALIAVGPSTPDSKASGAKVIAFYTKHHTGMAVTAFLLAYIGVVSLVYFTSVAGFLRRRGSELLSTLTAVGGVLFAGGFVLAAGVVVAADDAVKHQAPAAAQALNIVQNDAFAPMLFAGLGVALVSMGAAMLRTKALPPALGIVTIIIGVAGLTGVASWIALIVSAPLTIVVGAYVYQRQGQPSEVTIPEIPAARTSTEAGTRTKTKA